MTVCPDDVHWSECAKQVVAAINSSNSPAEAFDAAERWSVRYKKLYQANPITQWTVNENDKFEDGLKDFLSGELYKWTDPIEIGFDAALKKYFPSLAGVLGFLGGPVMQGFLTFINPSVIANDFVAAKPTNDDVNKALYNKVSDHLRPTWQSSYEQGIQKIFQQIKNKQLMP